MVVNNTTAKTARCLLVVVVRSIECLGLFLYHQYFTYGYNFDGERYFAAWVLAGRGARR